MQTKILLCTTLEQNMFYNSHRYHIFRVGACVRDSRSRSLPTPHSLTRFHTLFSLKRNKIGPASTHNINSIHTYTLTHDLCICPQSYTINMQFSSAHTHDSPLRLVF